MSKVLKPCPFCGRRADTSQNNKKLIICTTVGCALENLSFHINEWQTRSIEDALRAENGRLTAEVARLKAALSKYADDANWYGDILDGYKDCWVKNENGYNIARAALAESEPK